MKLLQPGDCAPISFFEVGDFIHAVEAFPGQGSIFSRSAGSFCQIRSINQAKSDFVKTNEVHNYAIVRLPSGAQRYISIKVKATLGIVYLINKTKVNRQKAGRRR
jgi:large subunit ribosomal protein L2